MGADIQVKIIQSEDKEIAMKEYLNRPITGIYLGDKPMYYEITKVKFHDEVFYNYEEAETESINKCDKWTFKAHAVIWKENNEIKWVVSAITPS